MLYRCIIVLCNKRERFIVVHVYDSGVQCGEVVLWKCIVMSCDDEE